jgi:hypothetical protein
VTGACKQTRLAWTPRSQPCARARAHSGSIFDLYFQDRIQDRQASLFQVQINHIHDRTIDLLHHACDTQAFIPNEAAPPQAHDSGA